MMQPASERTRTQVAAAPPLDYCIVEDTRVGARRMVRARSPQPGVSGERAYLHVGTDMSVSASAMRRVEPGSETITVGDVLKVHVRLSGASRVGVGATSSLPVGMASCSAIIHPDGERKIEHFGADVVEQSVTVACRPDWLANELGLADTPAPAPITRFMAGRKEGWFSVDAPLHPEAHRAARAILTEFAGDAPALLMVEARGLEILGHFFGHLRRAADGAPEPALHPRDRRLADNARAILDARALTPPSVSALAREVGTHQAKLMRIFKATHGRTISDYLEAARMERARELLCEGHHSITEVAFEAGYQHPANFTTAFKRYFGMPPSAARRGARGVAHK